MSLKQVAKDTLAILERGAYESASGVVVDIHLPLHAAVQGTITYSPADLSALLDARAPGEGQHPSVEVTGERTQEAAQRLAREGDVALLNFASARNAAVVS